MKKFGLPEPLTPTAFPVASAGIPIILALAFVTAVFALLGFTFLTLFFLVITVFVLFFFRDPDRAVPDPEGAVVSPADGKVVFVSETTDSYFAEPRLKISIFMSVFNVHVTGFLMTESFPKWIIIRGKFFNGLFGQGVRSQ